jgi:hypothetical protein
MGSNNSMMAGAEELPSLRQAIAMVGIGIN